MLYPLILKIKGYNYEICISFIHYVKISRLKGIKVLKFFLNPFNKKAPYYWNDFLLSFSDYKVKKQENPYLKPHYAEIYDQQIPKIWNNVLKLGYDPNALDKNGHTLFISSMRYLKVNESLIDLVDLNACSKTGDSPLMHALNNGNNHIIESLIEKDLNFNHINQHKRNCLFTLCEKNILKKMIQNGADVNQIDIDGSSPLTNIFSRVNSSKDWLQIIPLVEILLTMGANIDHSNKYQETALMMAANKGATNFVEVLLKFCPDFSLKNSFGKNVIRQIEERIEHTKATDKSSEVIKNLEAIEFMFYTHHMKINFSKDNFDRSLL